MEDHHAVLRGVRQVQIREVYAVLDIAVLQIVDQLVGCHNGAVILAFLRGSTQVRNSHDTLDTDGVLGGEIRYVGCNLTVCDSGLKIGRIDQIRTGQIDDAHTGLHLGDGIGTDHILGLGGGGNVQGNIVSLLKDLVVCSCLLNCSGQMPCTVDGDVRIASDNVHAEGCCRIGNQTADGTQADYAQGFAHDLISRKGGFAFLDRFSDICSQRICPLDTAYDIAGSQHQRGNGKLFNTVGVGTGGIEYDDTFLGTAIHRDVIYTGTCTADGFQGSTELHIVHSGRAHKNGIRICDCIADLVRIVKLLQANLGNFIKKLNLSHTIILDYLGFFSANSFMNATSFSTPSQGIAL